MTGGELGQKQIEKLFWKAAGDEVEDLSTELALEGDLDPSKVWAENKICTTLQVISETKVSVKMILWVIERRMYATILVGLPVLLSMAANELYTYWQDYGAASNIAAFFGK